MLNCLNVLLIFVIGSLNLVSSAFIDGMFVVALAAITMSGATFQPLPMTLLMSGWYFVVFLSRVSAVNLSLQYVTSMNCMVTSSIGASGGGEVRRLWMWTAILDEQKLSMAMYRYCGWIQFIFCVKDCGWTVGSCQECLGVYRNPSVRKVKTQVKIYSFVRRL